VPNDEGGKNVMKPFEAAIERLEEIVREIEDEEMELDQALALFEEGVRLLREAQSVLGSAQARVQQLVEDTEGLRLKDLPEGL
jgi:exodeoxyribonuclease VII small subunit